MFYTGGRQLPMPMLYWRVSEPVPMAMFGKCEYSEANIFLADYSLNSAERDEKLDPINQSM